MLERIVKELKEHITETAWGAVVGLLIVLGSSSMLKEDAHQAFYTIHPLHVLFSAFATASMYQIYCNRLKQPCGWVSILLIGYLGSIGIGTLSDSLLPYLGEQILRMPHSEAHIGFIEKWWLINPMAFCGIILAKIIPTTKLSHFFHVLLSTWASAFHVIMAMSGYLTIPEYLLIGIILFSAVWLPCCLSDIVFPLLFIKEDKRETCHI